MSFDVSSRSKGERERSYPDEISQLYDEIACDIIRSDLFQQKRAQNDYKHSFNTKVAK